ncbi:MAG: undecaprenyldiphospho-muramoylpentapeptide beta-N-acetylglucosaminyltransferase [Chitinophagaceae bacterium]|nr:undecaprenyldiphospho-muramoylpentapeptide beta-N-acetylglucosaminyltransferase [Chitinophagaceae bacterium]
MNDDKNLKAAKVPPSGGGGGLGVRIIIAGGGTGGHIFPAIAIANAILKLEPQTEILFVGAKGKMEMEKIPQAGFKIEGLDIAGFNRSSLIKNIGLPVKLLQSFFQVRKILKSFKPTAVIGVGGYSSFPVLRTAQAKGIPTFIHESNSFAGKSNIMLGRKAKKIFVASDGMEKFFPGNKIMIVGNPVRTSISQSTVTREEGIQFFGLDPAKRTVLSVGGSLGAKSINEALDTNLDMFEQNNLQLIWQTGKPYVEKAIHTTKGKPDIRTNDFITRMEFAYAAADLVISRSGAMAIAELCVMKKAVIFVPFPFAAEDHQTVNAQNLVNKNAGIMIKDSEALALLVPAIIALAKDEHKQEELKTNISKLAITNADEIIATEILKNI